MEFTVDGLSGLIDHFECMGPVTMHAANAVRSSSVTEQEHDLVSRFGMVAPEVPKSISVTEMRLRVALLKQMDLPRFQVRRTLALPVRKNVNC